MKKNRCNGGFTLIEMLCAILIMVFLIIGMGAGMESGMRIYRDAIFESESATLQGIVNTSLGDILRYSTKTRAMTPSELAEHGSDAGIAHVSDSTKRYVFTSLDYGIQDAYFYIKPHASGSNRGPVQMKNLRNAMTTDLVNIGAYPNLEIADFSIVYSPRVAPGIEGGYYMISYKIYSKTDETKVRNVESIVRVMND